MAFIDPSLEEFLPVLDKLSPASKAQWGNLNAQQMVEHLSDSLDIAIGKMEVSLQIPEDQVEGAVKYLFSDKPFPKLFKANYAKENPPLRNAELELAVDELVGKWIAYEEFFQENPEAKTLHPVYGMLDYKGWQMMNSKHFTHHFEQFSLI